MGAPGGDEEKNAPHRGLKFEHELLEGWIFFEVPPRERGVDLDAEACLVRPPHRLDRPVESPGQSPERVVGLAGRPIEAERDPLDPGFLQFAEVDPGEPRGG